MAEELTPLRGVRVLDLSQYLPGPYLTRLLADLGADVIKIESPKGDPARTLPPLAGDQSASFSALNWGKRSAVIDLKTPLGVEVMRAMVARVDVLVESFRPGVLGRLGLGWVELRAVNARLIYCSISGYGQDGGLRDVAGHDLNYLARAGVLAMFGPRDGTPVVPGIQIADLCGGALTAAVSVLAALLERSQTGQGRHLDISMTRGAAQFLLMEAARREAGTPEPRGGGFLTGGLPCYRVYRTKDDRSMALGALEPKFFIAFCERAGVPHLAVHGQVLGDDAAEAIRELEDVFASRTQAEWVELLAGSDCCCEPVRTPEEARADNDVGLNGVELAGLTVLATDLGAPPATPTHRDVPGLGQHGRAVARDLGVDVALVDRAVAQGAMLAGFTGDDSSSAS
ncbi:MAG: CaiB/BaiF CoA-transferase family protein [Myxococcota bacterium]